MKEANRRRDANRRAIAAAVAIASVAAFASLGGVGLAKSGAIALAQYQPGKKVTICHKGKNTITISLKAWPAHQRHGDTLGRCVNGHKPNNGKHNGNANHQPNPGSDTGTSTQSSTTGQTGHGNGKGNGHG